MNYQWFFDHSELDLCGLTVTSRLPGDKDDSKQQSENVDDIV